MCCLLFEVFFFCYFIVGCCLICVVSLAVFINCCLLCVVEMFVDCFVVSCVVCCLLCVVCCVLFVVCRFLFVVYCCLLIGVGVVVC